MARAFQLSRNSWWKSRSSRRVAFAEFHRRIRRQIQVVFRLNSLKVIRPRVSPGVILNSLSPGSLFPVFSDGKRMKNNDQRTETILEERCAEAQSCKVKFRKFRSFAIVWEENRVEFENQFE